jgi:acyl carrier protein
MYTKFDPAVFEKIKQAVEKTVAMEGRCLTTECRLSDDLNLARFGRIRLGLSLEETFGTEIPDEAMAQFDTIGDIVRYMSLWML